MNINVKYFNTFGYMPNYGKLQPSIRKIKNFKDLTFTIFYAILMMTILPLEGGPYIGHRIKVARPNKLILERVIQDRYEISRV